MNWSILIFFKSNHLFLQFFGTISTELYQANLFCQKVEVPDDRIFWTVTNNQHSKGRRKYFIVNGSRIRGTTSNMHYRRLIRHEWSRRTLFLASNNLHRQLPISGSGGLSNPPHFCPIYSWLGFNASFAEQDITICLILKKKYFCRFISFSIITQVLHYFSICDFSRTFHKMGRIREFFLGEMQFGKGHNFSTKIRLFFDVSPVILFFFLEKDGEKERESSVPLFATTVK